MTLFALNYHCIVSTCFSKATAGSDDEVSMRPLKKSRRLLEVGNCNTSLAQGFVVANLQNQASTYVFLPHPHKTLYIISVAIWLKIFPCIQAYVYQAKEEEFYIHLAMANRFQR